MKTKKIILAAVMLAMPLPALAGVAVGGGGGPDDPTVLPAESAVDVRVTHEGEIDTNAGPTGPCYVTDVCVVNQKPKISRVFHPRGFDQDGNGKPEAWSYYATLTHTSYKIKERMGCANGKYVDAIRVISQNVAENLGYPTFDTLDLTHDYYVAFPAPESASEVEVEKLARTAAQEILDTYFSSIKDFFSVCK